MPVPNHLEPRRQRQRQKMSEHLLIQHLSPSVAVAVVEGKERRNEPRQPKNDYV
jgi:hypothetical protein